jgi:hypothetical protein
MAFFEIASRAFNLNLHLNQSLQVKIFQEDHFYCNFQNVLTYY